MKDHKLERHIAMLREGDNSAFDYIYEQTNRTVYFCILYIVREKMTAEDIMQETYVRAITSLGQYGAGTNFSAWLCTIAKSIALNHIKKYKREVPTDFNEQSHKYGSAETHLPYIFDLASKILAEDEYEILMLCQVAGYKRREVAQMLGIPIGTVTWKNNEALKKLKKHIDKEGGV